MMFRFVALLCMFAAGCVYAENYTWGMRQHNDRLLNRHFANKSSSFLRVVTLDVYYPNKNIVNSTRSVINQIQVIDQMKKGKGGYASLMRGGVGFNNTAIHLKSQRGEGINFIVDIYGVN